MARKLRYTEEWKKKTHGRGPFVDVFSEFGRHQRDPRAAVLVAHGFIEVLVSTLIEARCKNAHTIASADRDFSHFVKLVLLNEIGCITDERYRSLNILRQIRNRAAHDAFFEITQVDLNICEWPKNYRPRINESSVEERQWAFVQKLTFLFAAVWNDHNKLFDPIFGEKGKPPKTDGGKQVNAMIPN